MNHKRTRFDQLVEQVAVYARLLKAECVELRTVHYASTRCTLEFAITPKGERLLAACRRLLDERRSA